MTENYDCETCGRHLRDCLRAQQNDNDGYPCCPECEHFRERPIITTECPSVSPRAARQAWGASKPAPPLPTHEFVGRLNWMGQPALAFREFCEICDKHRDHANHRK